MSKKRSWESSLHLWEQHGNSPRRNDMTAKERRKFGPLCCAWLESIGARDGAYYDFEIDTRAGVLAITPYDNWIACRFDEPDRADCGSSGKWNHYHFDARIMTGAPRATAEMLLKYFKLLLSPLLLLPPEAAE